MAYESKLILGEVHSALDHDPAPMWMNPVIEMRLAAMGRGSFATLRDDARYAGVYIHRSAGLEYDQTQAVSMAVDFIGDHAPAGAFAREVPWWIALKELAEFGHVEHRQYEDPNGEPFKRLPIRATAEACREEFEEGEGAGYRRALLAAEVLEHFVRAISDGRWQEYDPGVDGTDPQGKIMLIHEGY